MAFARIWKQLAKSYRGVVSFAATEISNVLFGGEKKIGPFVQIFYGDRGMKPNQYSGPINILKVNEFIREQLNRVLQIQLASELDEPAIAPLNANNFDDRINGSPFPWVVKFYTDWCGLCKNMKVPWEQAATQLSKKYAFGEVDCELHKDFCNDLGVEGYPTIYIFPPYTQQETVGTLYNGNRDNTAEIIKSLERKYTEMKFKEPTIQQLVDPDQFTDECMKTLGCIIFFLPRLYVEGSAETHKVYLKNLNMVVCSYQAHE